MINLPINGQVVDVHISKLIADPDQPRKTFENDSLQALAASIAKSGILVPLLVRRGEADGTLIIHDGERRYRAAQLAKLETVPVIVTATSDNVRLEQFAMNNLREQLKPMEIARMLADMQRKHFASTNDLAAHLDRSGLPAMTPKQIDETIALVDLPEWLQAMIDVSQIDASAAMQVQKVAHLPQVLEWLKESIAEDVTIGGKATDKDVSYAINSAGRILGADLSTDDWRSNPPHFNPKKICKGCEFKLTTGQTSYCMKPEEFERKNTDAKAAGLLPGGKKPQKPVAPDKANEQQEEHKVEQRSFTLGEKVRDYLHGYLVQRIVVFMQKGDPRSNLIDITDELLAWHSMGRPGAMTQATGYGAKAYDASAVLGISSLEDLFASKEMESLQLNAALEIAHTLPWRETQVICHELWGTNVEVVWTMDEAYVNLFRRAELLHLVERHSLANRGGKTWDKLKVGELKAAILDQADNMQRPQILQGIYETVAAPYVPWSKRSQSTSGGELDDEDIDGEDGDFEFAA